MKIWQHQTTRILFYSIMAKKPIRSIEQLDREIYRHKLRVKEVEHSLDRNFDHLRHHFPSMIIRTVMGRNKPSTPAGFAGDVALRLMESEQLQDGFLSFIDKLATRLGRVFKRKDRSASPSDPVGSEPLP